MIVSHKHKFIFIKPKKVAGTSIEINLSKHCGENDIVTPITDFRSEFDEDYYVHFPRNYEEKGLFNHVTPDKIKKEVGEKVWNEYFKFTVVRNPYDQVVSRYLFIKNDLRVKLEEKTKFELIKITLVKMFKVSSYQKMFKKFFKKRKKYQSFDKFIYSLRSHSKNLKYYFNEKGEPICDFYIKFENLEEDYKKVCGLIGVPYEKLPKTKNKTRKEKEHYSEYYNEHTKDKIYRVYKKEIDFFDYKFEKLKD